MKQGLEGTLLRSYAKEQVQALKHIMRSKKVYIFIYLLKEGMFVC